MRPRRTCAIPPSSVHGSDGDQRAVKKQDLCHLSGYNAAVLKDSHVLAEPYLG